MSILLALLAVAGTLGVILWRLQVAAEAAKGLTGAAKDAHGLFRGWSWRRKLAKDPLDLIRDAREAAVTMMCAMAQSDGPMTERERRAILAQTVQRFEASAKQAEDLLAHGRWLAREVRDVDRCFRKLAPFLQKSCRPDQLGDVLAMLEAVSSADGDAGNVEKEALARLARDLAPYITPESDLMPRGRDGPE